LGVPPFGGFASKLLLFEAAAQLDGRYLALFLAATSLGLVALVRLAQNRLLGAPEEQAIDEQPVLLGTTELDRPAERRLEPEPRGLAIVTLVLLGACLVVGVFPQPIIATIAEVVQGLTFVRA
jgi:formate hydrogenlyase subunit 3/multisubunit Na+/H+ antiporter MnhD subunit